MTTAIPTTAVLTADLAASIRQYPLAIGTEVTFFPARADYDGRDASTGVVTERITERDSATADAGSYQYVIACPGGASASRNGYLTAADSGELIAAVVPTALLQPAPGSGAHRVTDVLPRTAADALRIAAYIPAEDDITAALATLVKFLPGGEVEQQGLALSNDRSLCAVYDRTVVPAMGFTVRDHCAGEVPGHLVDAFTRTIADIERDMSDARDGLRTMAMRYVRGGVVNQAIIDAIADHLEAHKVPAANALLEALDMDTAPTASEYSVIVTVTRTITVEQEVELFVQATDEDDAHDQVSTDALADATGDTWTAEDGSELYIGSASRYDIDDWTVDTITATR